MLRRRKAAGRGPAERRTTLAGPIGQDGLGARIGNIGVSRSFSGGTSSTPSTAGQPIGLLLALTKAA